MILWALNPLKKKLQKLKSSNDTLKRDVSCHNLLPHVQGIIFAFKSVYRIVE